MSLQEEIRAIEKRLGMTPEEGEEEKACVKADDLGEEIAALEEEIEGCERRASRERGAAHKFQGEIWDEADQELADLYNEINSEDESILEKGAEGDVGFMDNGCQNVRCQGDRQKADFKRLASRAGNLFAAEVKNPVEDPGRGRLWQDYDEVEELMGVEDKALERGLDVVQDTTDFTDAEFIYAKRLKEASMRLDRVADALEGRGGKWVKVAARVDKLADAIDVERHASLKKVAARKASGK